MRGYFVCSSSVKNIKQSLPLKSSKIFFELESKNWCRNSVRRTSLTILYKSSITQFELSLHTALNHTLNFKTKSATKIVVSRFLWHNVWLHTYMNFLRTFNSVDSQNTHNDTFLVLAREENTDFLVTTKECNDFSREKHADFV